MVIEIMTFRLRDQVARSDFLLADRRVQTEFAYRQPGMLRRTTGRDQDGNWVVVDLWESASAADDCLPGWHHHPAPVAFMALVDDTTVRTQRFDTLD